MILYDNGIGVHMTLHDAGNIEHKSHKYALRTTLEPGVTGVSGAERKAQHAKWRNSGFGLYVTSRLCAENGIFRIISGNAGMTRSVNGETLHDWRFDGTCVQLKLNTANLGNAGERIMEIVREGEMAIQKMGTTRSASSASKSLSSWLD